MKRKMNFLGLNISTGQEHRGPACSCDNIRSYFFNFKKFGIDIIDCGNVHSKPENFKKLHGEDSLKDYNWTHYKEAQLKVSNLLNQDLPLLNWGGDHSVAISTVSAFCQKYPTGHVLWIDAHADINLPQYSFSGNLHGMPLSVLLNLDDVSKKYFPWIAVNLRPEKLIYVGLRDLDPFEVQSLKVLNIKCYTSKDIRILGMDIIAADILNICKNDPLHISFDIDSVSPEFAPATGLPVADGLSPSDLKTLGATLSTHNKITSADVVEINPLIGNAEDVIKTNSLAISFINNIFSQNPLSRNESLCY